MFGRHFTDGFTGFAAFRPIFQRAFVTKEHEPRSTRMMLMRRTLPWCGRTRWSLKNPHNWHLVKKSLPVGLPWFTYCLLHCWLEGTLSQASDTPAFGKTSIRGCSSPFPFLTAHLTNLIYDFPILFFSIRYCHSILHLQCHMFWCEQQAFLDTLEALAPRSASCQGCLVVAFPGGHEFLGRWDVIVFFLSHAAMAFPLFCSGDWTGPCGCRYALQSYLGIQFLVGRHENLIENWWIPGLPEGKPKEKGTKTWCQRL